MLTLFDSIPDAVEVCERVQKNYHNPALTTKLVSMIATNFSSYSTFMELMNAVHSVDDPSVQTAMTITTVSLQCVTML